MVIIDTSIIIDHLRASHKGKSVFLSFSEKHSKESLAISVITVQELYEGKSTKDPQKEKMLLATIAPLKIFPYSFEIAKMAGEIARDMEKPIELADAAIAAISIIQNAELLTLNRKDFSGIPNLDLLEL